MARLQLKTSQRPLLKIAVVSVVSGVSLFLLGFFIFQALYVATPTEETRAANPSPLAGTMQLAMDFNGKTGFVSVGNPNLGISNKMTVTAWVRWDTLPAAGSQWANIVTYTTRTPPGSGDNGIFWLQHNSDNSKFEFALQTVNGRQFIQSVTRPVRGVWYHLAGVYDGSRVRIYVNGVEEGSVSNSGNVVTPTSNHELTIGEWANSNNGYRRFNGQVDEVSIWNKNLTVNEIKDIMCKSIDPSSNKLKAYWNFNDNSNPNKTYDLTSSHLAGNITASQYVSSGAPVGNQNSYYYTTTAPKFRIVHPNGDSIVFDNFSSPPQGIQLYFLSTVDNSMIISNNTDLLMPNRTFGAFIVSALPVRYNVTYYYKNNPNADVVDPINLVMASRPSADTIWTALAASNDAENRIFTYSGLTNRAEIALGTKTNPLPISLLTFKATGMGNKVQLSWSTASEINNDYFTIEKSRDARSWEKVAVIQGAGNSNEVLEYNTLDDNPFEGLSYYRLSQTDYDGKFEIFAPVKVDLSPALPGFELKNLSPNPFTDKLFADISSEADAMIQIRIFSSMGNLMLTRDYPLRTGNNSLTIGGLGSFRQGIYLLGIYAGKQVLAVQKISKQ